MDAFTQTIPFMVDNFGLLVQKTEEHLYISLLAMVISLIIGLPIGLWLGHIHKGEFLAVSVTNIGRALPSLALIAIFIGLVGVGLVNVTIALVLLAVPPILSYAFVALNSIDRNITKAARGMGMSSLQVLWNVELPLGLPTIFAGIRTSTVLVVSSATLATIAGGGGLGDIILNQVAYGMEGVVAGALWVAALSIIADQLMGLASKLIAPKGVRRLSAETAVA